MESARVESGIGGYSEGIQLVAHIVYILLDLVLAFTPVIFYFEFIAPIMRKWDTYYNRLYKFSWDFMWISNIMLYGTPILEFIIDESTGSHLFELYVAYSLFGIVFGGSALQAINFFLLLFGQAFIPVHVVFHF